MCAPYVSTYFGRSCTYTIVIKIKIKILKSFNSYWKIFSPKFESYLLRTTAASLLLLYPQRFAERKFTHSFAHRQTNNINRCNITHTASRAPRPRTNLWSNEITRYAANARCHGQYCPFKRHWLFYVQTPLNLKHFMFWQASSLS